VIQKTLVLILMCLLMSYNSGCMFTGYTVLSSFERHPIDDHLSVVSAALSPDNIIINGCRIYKSNDQCQEYYTVIVPAKKLTTVKVQDLSGIAGGIVLSRSLMSKGLTEIRDDGNH
jgi:hypothetical protein